jgi:hypothetical protein
VVVVVAVGLITDYPVDLEEVEQALLAVQQQADLLPNQDNLIPEPLSMLDSQELLTALMVVITEPLVPGCTLVVVVVVQEQQAATLVNLDQATLVLIE